MIFKRQVVGVWDVRLDHSAIKTDWTRRDRLVYPSRTRFTTCMSLRIVSSLLPRSYRASTILSGRQVGIAKAGTTKNASVVSNGSHCLQYLHLLRPSSSLTHSCLLPGVNRNHTSHLPPKVMQNIRRKRGYGSDFFFTIVVSHLSNPARLFPWYSVIGRSPDVSPWHRSFNRIRTMVLLYLVKGLGNETVRSK